VQLQIVCAAVIKVSSGGLGFARKERYVRIDMSRLTVGVSVSPSAENEEEPVTLAFEYVKLVRAFAAPARCPQCGDWMIAPVSSEFVIGREIRHQWECDACGESTSSVIDIPPYESEPQERAA
jgi:predicted RNA-binding Zn-ribbon protein involved in translation (DUF1610 family)